MTSSFMICTCAFLGLVLSAVRGDSSENESRNSLPIIGTAAALSRFNYQQGETNVLEFVAPIRNRTDLSGYGKTEFDGSVSLDGNPGVKTTTEDEWLDSYRAVAPNGRNITGMMRRFAENEHSECLAIYSCFDCFTARLCRPTGDGKFEEVLRVKCPPSTPNCDSETGTCMYRKEPLCMEPDDFVCLSDGNFPDVNCKFYHVCTDLKAEKHQCEDKNENYNAERGSCDFLTKQCGFFDCYQLDPGVKTPFTTAPNYFAYCGKDQRPVFIDKCSEGTWLNTTTQRCEPMCSQREELLRDPTDCTKYYKCHKLWLTQTSWVMIKEQKSCPPGTGFVSEEFSCVSLRHFPPPCVPDLERRTGASQLREMSVG